MSGAPSIMSRLIPDPDFTFQVTIQFILRLRKSQDGPDNAEECFDWATERLMKQPPLENQVRNFYRPAPIVPSNTWNLYRNGTTHGASGGGGSSSALSSTNSRDTHVYQKMELTSPKFIDSNVHCFGRGIKAVNHALQGKAYTDKSTALSIRFDIPVGPSHRPLDGLNVEAARLLYLLWAGSEAVMESFQPHHRRSSNNPYCRSLFVKIERDRPDLATRYDKLRYLAQKLSRCTSRAGIIEDVIGGQPGHSKSKLDIIFRTPTGRAAVEFREHCGTLSDPEIGLWYNICRMMLLFAYKNRAEDWSSGWLLDLFHQTQTLSGMANLIGLSSFDERCLRERQARFAHSGGDDDIVFCQ